MKLKSLPEDFQVEELLLPALDVRAAPSTAGTSGPSARYALYRLTKRSLGTPEAVREICRAWRLAPGRVSYGGLKDRHALAIQHLTIAGGPPRDLSGKLWSLVYLGPFAEPFAARHFAGNRFRIVLRALTRRATSRLRLHLEQAQRDGVANYFDEQRFRSVGRGGRFVARALIDGDFQAAVKLALAEPYAHDRASAKSEKEMLRRSWGNWPVLAAALGAGPARRVAVHLADHPDDFRGAFTRLPPELQSLYLSAYQSHLWNRVLALWLNRHLPPSQRCRVRCGGALLPMPRKLTAEQTAKLKALELPLPSARLSLPADEPLAGLYEEALASDGLTLARMKIAGLRAPFFSKGARAALFFPEALEAQRARDERQEGKWKLSLEFALPRGCYATMLIKRIAAVVL